MSRARFRGTRRRLVALVLAIVVIAVGLLTRLGPSGDLTDIAGDALYAVLIYLLVVVVAPGAGVVARLVFAAAWCVAIELLQLTAVPGAAAEAFAPLRLVLGTAFDVRDLVVYVAAVAVAAAADATARRVHVIRRARARADGADAATMR